MQDLDTRLQSVFKDQSQVIFDFSDTQIRRFIQDTFREKVIPVFEEADLELLDENLNSDDFLRFTSAVVKL